MRVSQISYKSTVFKIYQGAEDARNAQQYQAPSQKKAKSSFHSYQNGRGEQESAWTGFVGKTSKILTRLAATCEPAIWIRIPRRLSHRVSLYHQPTLPYIELRHQIQARIHQKAWDGAGHFKKTCPDTSGTFQGWGRGHSIEK